MSRGGCSRPGSTQESKLSIVRFDSSSILVANAIL
eukprot:gene26396-biopygen16271